jgi:NAD-dependent deacetylase
MKVIDLTKYQHILFFTGAGMSAESGVPIYRGSGGIWHQYNWQEYACQKAFDRNPQKVLKFHELRRQSVLQCKPHRGHFAISELERKFPHVTVVTQNIDGMHQRAGSRQVVELHGSLWRLRCRRHGVLEDLQETYGSYTCHSCGEWMRPDIIWFGDQLNLDVIEAATDAISRCDLFISIGTSGVVWPAAGFPKIAKEHGAYLIEINPEPSQMSRLYDRVIAQRAGPALVQLTDGLNPGSNAK